ncbi:hypothetical protein NDU88_000674 [Pleurodeles waltl]|uniref:Uncharacterized protein n=1 Tax=Pleurodeles waltl TaxID=8319 RepID=A0AAV7P4T4_PLEWA|nr:hypothetical protein NDU88_000674 [Pleurodeles waltl]
MRSSVYAAHCKIEDSVLQPTRSARLVYAHRVGNKITAVHPTPSCPLHWEQHGRKCYYFPGKKDEKSWSASHEDCSSRSSRLVVIEDKAELVRHQ